MPFDLKFLEKVESEHVGRELKNKLGQRSRHCLTQMEVVPSKRIIVIKRSTVPARGGLTWREPLWVQDLDLLPPLSLD